MKKKFVKSLVECLLFYSTCELHNLFIFNFKRGHSRLASNTGFSCCGWFLSPIARMKKTDVVQNVPNQFPKFSISL